MIRMMKRSALILGALLMTVAVGSAQSEREGEEAFSIQGYPGQATAIRWRGRVLVDVEDLARMTNGSLTFEKARMILTMSRSDGVASAPDDSNKAGFSPAFRRAAIEAMASIREWGGMLQVMVQNGYPVGKAMAGSTIRAYQGRAADTIALAAAAASTDSDYRGIDLLRNEFNNVEAWADSFVEDRNAMRAVNLTTSEHPLRDDEEAQKIMHCGQFLGQMFAGGAFQDDASCH